MARRRLSPLPDPTSPPTNQNVPRAEHLPGSASPLLASGLHASSLHAPGLPPAPIARIAAEAAGSAALQELADTLTRARETGRLVLDLTHDAIAPDHLDRDRLPAEDEEMAALRESLRTHGQRTPIEVVALSGASSGSRSYGLISGWRRLTALKALHAETGDARFATVQALVRRPETAADAYVAMVEENELRVGLSQYERARVAARAVARGVFPDEKTALLTLFATASRPKRSRIRAFLELFHGLDAHLRFPAAIPERLGLALVDQLRGGQGEAIAAALAAAAPATAEAEIALLESLAGPALASPVSGAPAPAEDRPAAVLLPQDQPAETPPPAGQHPEAAPDPALSAADTRPDPSLDSPLDSPLESAAALPANRPEASAPHADTPDPHASAAGTTLSPGASGPKTSGPEAPARASGSSRVTPESRLTLETRLTGQRLTFTLTGPAVDPALATRIEAAITALLAPVSA